MYASANIRLIILSPTLRKSLNFNWTTIFSVKNRVTLRRHSSKNPNGENYRREWMLSSSTTSVEAARRGPSSPHKQPFPCRPSTSASEQDLRRCDISDSVFADVVTRCSSAFHICFIYSNNSSSIAAISYMSLLRFVQYLGQLKLTPFFKSAPVLIAEI